MKRLLTIALTGVLALGALPLAGLPGMSAEAKTIASAKGEKIFLYADDQEGKPVLTDIIDLEDLKAISHGQNDEENYYYSSTDNYPTTQYCEARGITIDELLDFAEEDSSVLEKDDLHFRSGDAMAFMATDSYGNYTRTWTYDALCAPERYYFEGMLDPEKGWKTAWEVAGEDTSKYGIDMAEYNAKYRDNDKNYEAKREAFETGVKMPVLLATDSFSGRTTTATLVASTEAGISEQIADNGGVAAGSLKDMLTDETALRLCIPMTEADLMAAHRTAYDNFKWIYNMKLKMENSSLVSQGTVAEPTATFRENGNTLTITLDCETPDASIYYSFDGAPQQLYTDPITYDTGGADLSANPVTIYMTAVREGFDDAGVVMTKYPQSGVVFKSLYSSMTGQAIVFEAESGVSDADWNRWTSAILGISLKKPSDSSYVALNAGDYSIDSTAKKLIFAPTVASEPGAYAFMVYARGFSNKRLTVSLKNAAPAVSDVKVPLGSAVMIPFDNADYQKNLYLNITPEGGKKQTISTSYLDRAVPGQVTILESWFAMESCPVKEAGTYILELTNGSYAPASQTVTLTLTEPQRFVDVQEDDWFAQAVSWAVKHEVFNGVSDNEFAPGSSMTRAMFATVLWRMNDKPEATGSNPFQDVEADTWYTDAILWANQEGYVTGYGDGTFGVMDPITREQIATILFRYTSKKEAAEGSGGETGGPASVRGDLEHFTDKDDISDWAKEGLSWANGIKMIKGVSEHELAPKALATRAQAAMMLMNYSDALSADDPEESGQENGAV